MIFSRKSSRRLFAIKTIIYSSLVLFVLPARAEKNLSMVLDYAVFRYDSAQVLTEIYYSIPTAELEFTQSGDLLMAEAAFHIRVLKSGDLWQEGKWRMQRELAADAVVNPEDRMMDAVGYQMEEGEYSIELSVEDLNDPENRFSISKAISVSLPHDERLSLSSLQLASSIKKMADGVNNVFCKNGLEVVPNPESVFGKGSPMLFYYLEAYHLEAATSDSAYKTNVSVTDGAGNQVPTIKGRRQVKKIIPASVEVGALNVSSLPSGQFFVNFDILDAQDQIRASTRKKFFIYNPDKPAEAAVDSTAQRASAVKEYAGLSEKELDVKLQQTKYVAEKGDITDFKLLKTADAKRRYLADFWRNRDPSPGAPFNEFKDRYEGRVAVANKEFRTISRAGWKTDRGRVYILYGNPSDIERNPNNAGSYSYQVWHYESIEGGVLFVFADFQEYGEYRQLHSTKRGEPKNENWERVIKKDF